MLLGLKIEVEYFIELLVCKVVLQYLCAYHYIHTFQCNLLHYRGTEYENCAYKQHRFAHICCY